VTAQDVLLVYQEKLGELQSSLSQLRLPHTISVSVLTIAVCLFLTLGLFALRKEISVMWPSLPVPFAAVSARLLRRNHQKRSRLWRLKRFYERGVQRLTGTWARTGRTGEQFRDEHHVYSTDLHVLGEGSLYELLCVARTQIGQRGLANYLLRTPDLTETLRRQEAVSELSHRTDLRERIETLGESDYYEANQHTFDEFLNQPALAVPRLLRIVSLTTSIFFAGTVVAGFLSILPWRTVATYAGPVLAFHSAAGLIFRRRVNQMIEAVQPASVETTILREGLRLLEHERFQSPKLCELVEQVRNGAQAVRTLDLLLGALQHRDKDWFYGPSRWVLFGTQVCAAIDQWHRDHGSSLRKWLNAWAEFEALNALATYSYENPQNTFPAFLDNTCFEADGLGHPLLPHASCVANDVRLNQAAPFYIVSGSNMSGKSTLLRAVGLNAVLAFAGAPVRANRLQLSGLSVFASISVTDSLLTGKSKFLAEVDRLRQAIESREQGRPVLFLIDEILSGTNSRDRRIASEAVVRALLSKGAIGALSTHDLALTEITNSLPGVNVHMGSREGSDPLDFDYRLKTGVTQESNALVIARMAGVPV